NRPATEPARPAQPAPAETPVDAAKPEELTPRPPPAALQTTSTQLEEKVGRQIDAKLGQALADLNKINYQNLSSNGKTQYDAAKRFVSLGQQALREKNLVFASTMADKAATMAAQLLGR